MPLVLRGDGKPRLTQAEQTGQSDRRGSLGAAIGRSSL